MKTVLNLVLAACVICLVYICYGSIMGPINFDKAKKTREKAIIARLIDIRKAQQEYRTVHNGAYTANFDSLITFVKTAKLPFIMKVGSLTDDQLNNGMTEKKAMDLINVPYGNGAKFEMAIRQDTTKSGAPLNLFQAQVAYDVYLGDLNSQELINLKDMQSKLGKYCGLRVGDIEQPNNNAGNWE